MGDPLSVTASVVGIISLGITVTQSLVDFYSASRGQKSDVASTVKKLDNLLELLEHLCQHLNGRQFKAEEQSLLKNIEDWIVSCQESIQELDRNVKKFQASSTSSIRTATLAATHRLSYPFKLSTLRKLDADVDEIVSELTLAWQALQSKDIGTIQKDIDDAKALLDLVRADQISSKVHKWLNAPDAITNYNEAQSKKHPGTGRWFVEGSSFSDWLTSSTSLIWLYGFAGCGKSVLCSTAIQYTLRHRRSNPRIGLAFFFFSFSDESKKNASAMLRSLIIQLSSQLNDNHSLLSRMHDSYRSATPPDQALLDCLHQIIKLFDHVYIILDALDESPRNKYQEDMLQTLVKIWGWQEQGLHLLVTSRNEPDIRDVVCEELHASPDECISVMNESMDEDIAAYITNHLKSSRALRRWEKYHTEIEKALTERAHGVFRWVECQFTSLKSGPGSKRQLDALLASLPRSLDETYERMLMNIDGECAEDARRILILLCCAKRPLRPEEVIDAVAVELGDDPRFNMDGRLLGADELHRVCPGLIEVDAERYDELSEYDSTVRIAHFSVKEYLESQRIFNSKAARFGVRGPSAHSEIASLSLTYLLDPELVVLENEYPLTNYAANFWYEHLRDGEHNDPLAQQQALQLFQSSEGQFEKWSKIYSEHSDERFTKCPSRIYYASNFNLDLVLISLLEHNSPGMVCSDRDVSRISSLVNEPVGVYGNALQVASFAGNEKIVRLLLDHNADSNARGEHYGNPLQAASFMGHKEIVQMLLERNANVNAQGGRFGNALQAASYRGHEEIVQMLLERNANVNAQGGRYGDALQAASYRGHEEIVQILLERNANVNAQGGSHGNALQAASTMGHEEIVQILLEAGAYVNAYAGS